MARRRHREASGRGEAAARERSSRRQTQSGRRVWFWVSLGGVGLLLRVALILMTKGSIYPGDHDDFVRWGIQATDEGVLSLYDKAPPRHPWRTWRDGRPGVGYREFDRVCNYPPLSAYLLWGSGAVFRTVSADRLINTAASRIVFCSWGMLGDVLVAAGCAALVALLRPGSAARWTYVLMLLLPPLWWDSVMWGQMDSVVMAPAVWMLYALLRNRWLTAGVLWGVAFGLKPQAILFVPVWGLALLIGRPFWRPVLGGVMAGLVLLLSTLPFYLHSGWAWFRLSYQETLFSTYAHLTTLKAFNIWYLDLLLSDSLDSSGTWLGFTKDAWGKLLLGLALLAGFVFVLWRWRQDRRGLLVWTTICLLSFVILPTQVHERYIILTLPFLAVAAAWSWRSWPGLLLLVVVTMAQVSWPLWLRTPAGQWPDIEKRVKQSYAEAQAKAGADPFQKLPSLEETLRAYEAPYRKGRMVTLGYEWTYTILSLLGTAGAGAALAALLPRSVAAPSPPHRAAAPGPRVRT